MQMKVLQSLHQTPAHVACLCGLDSGIHQSFSATHGVEEEFQGRQARVERVADKALASRGLVTSWEMGKGAILQADKIGR